MLYKSPRISTLKYIPPPSSTPAAAGSPFDQYRQRTTPETFAYIAFRVHRPSLLARIAPRVHRSSRASLLACIAHRQQPPWLRWSATASPPQRGLSPGGGGGGDVWGTAPQQIAEGRGGSKGLTFSPNTTPHSMLCLHKHPCAYVPWLLVRF